MNTYYFRTTDRAALVQVGVDLGLLVDDAGGTRAAIRSVSWDEVGPLYENEQLIVDGQGVPYFHANMLMPGDLNEWAAARYADAVAVGDSALAARIAQHIEDAPGFFVLNEQGIPRKPNSPQRLFWL